MKKILIVIILLILIPIKTYAISSECIVVMDQDSKRIIYQKNKDKQRLVASISKIMTALLAVESGKMDDIVKIDDTVLKSYGSGIYIQPKEEISLRDLVYGLMLRSGNDAALMIAKYVGKDEEKFVKLMNEKAKKIGMKNSNFQNPSGLDNGDGNGNFSTAYDMAILMSYAMKNDEFKIITGTKKHTVKTNRMTYVWNNKNKLLNNYQYTTGGKTGFTEKAKRTLVSTATYNNLNLVIVTLNDGNDFLNHQNLYEEMFNTYKNYKILSKKNFKVIDDKYYKDKLYINNDLYYPLKDNEGQEFTTKIKLEKIKNYNNNQKVGIVEIYFKKVLVYEEDIYVEVKEKKSIINRIKGWFK